MAPEKLIVESEVLCEHCKRSFAPNKILKHIGHVHVCKSFYGPRFDELKKEQQRKKVEKFRSKLSKEENWDVLVRQRKALDQIERNKTLQQEKNTGNENSGEEMDFVEDKTGEKWQCEFCKTFWIPTSILMHIGKNEHCKSHYGPRFEDLKKKHKSIYKQYYREVEGTKKELEQQRKKYASDQKVKERKRKYYQEGIENQRLFEYEQEMERRKKKVKRIARTAEDGARYENKMRFDSNEWIHDFFMHFFETFKDVSVQTKHKIISLEKHIDRIYIMNEFKIDELADNVNLAIEDILYFQSLDFQIYGYFKVGDQYIRSKIRATWNDLKKTMGSKLREIYEQVEEPNKKSNWYRSLKRFYEIYVDREFGRTMDFLEKNLCIICKDRAHQISFPPEDSFNKIWYYGTRVVEPKYSKESFNVLIVSQKNLEKITNWV